LGLAEDLNALQDLRAKGELSESAYSAARDAAIDRHAVPPTASRRLGRFIGFRAIPLLIILFVVATVVWYNAGTRKTTIAMATVVHAPITVIDEVENVPASAMKGIAINLPYGGAIDVTVAVVSGNPVDIFLTDASQAETVRKQEWSSVRAYPDFNATKTKSYRRVGQLRQGGYYLVLRDTSLGILSSSASDISVKVRLNP
jgi:hypothetical protein